MIPFTLDEVAQLASGSLTTAGSSGCVTGVTIDSRLVVHGDLFVAVGSGSGYVDEALARGAAAALVPNDAYSALAAIGGASARARPRVSSASPAPTARHLRRTSSPRCSGRSPVSSPPRRASTTELGVPLTLGRLEPDTEVLVLELAMRGFGQIADLAAFARPEIGIVTNVGPAHLEKVGSLAGVVRAKAELVESLPSGGTAIVPVDFPVARDDLDVRRFGPGAKASVERWRPTITGATVRFRVEERR